MAGLHDRLRGLLKEQVRKHVPESITKSVEELQSGTPLHEVVRRHAPAPVTDYLKEKVRPPAWEHPKHDAPDWALDKKKITWVPGMKATIFGDNVVAMQDAKHKDLREPVPLPFGTEGTITAVGDTYLMVHFPGQLKGFKLQKPDLTPSRSNVRREWDPSDPKQGMVLYRRQAWMVPL